MCRMQALTRRLQSWWTTAPMAFICRMTGCEFFWLRTETVMRSGLRRIWTVNSKLCYAKRQPKCPRGFESYRPVI